MTLFLILLGGELTVTERLMRQISGARVIAADSGMRHAAALGVNPELWIGDFDSSDAALQESLCVEIATKDMASEDVRRHLTDTPEENLSKGHAD